MEEALKKAEKNQQLWVLAAALETAYADGVFDREEMLILNRFCDICGVSLTEVTEFRDKALKETDELGIRIPAFEPDTQHPFIPLTVDEAVLALCAWVAFSDDNPADREIALIREHFTINVLTSLDKKMEEGGYSYPDDLPEMKESIIAALKTLRREELVNRLGLVYKTAAADSIVDKDELSILKEFCEIFLIGIGELQVL